MNPFSKSLRARFLLTAAVLGLALLAISGYGHHLVRATGAKAQAGIEAYYGTHRLILNAKDALNVLEKAVHNRLAEKGAENAVPQAIAGFQVHLKAVIQSTHVQSQANFSGLPEAAKTLLTRLQQAEDQSPSGMDGLQVVDGLRDVLHLMERRIYDAMVDQAYSALDASRTLSWIIWGLALVIFIVVMSSYSVFELSIRRPLLLVAEALRAEGRGKGPVPDVPVPRAIETFLLIDAFNGMREKVRSRQLRLQSVLENTSDGIITFDAAGIIESINGAAERVLGYGRDEVAGRPISEIIPVARAEDGGVMRSVGVSHLSDLVEGSELELPASRKDGETFHLSLKLSTFTIGDQRYFNALISDITDRKAMFDKLTFLAQRDPLTGLVNRRFFFEDMDKAVAFADRHSENGMAVISIDLDRFKYVNDSLGHQAGDCLLKEVSGVLQERLRKTDVLARLGGDEFAVLLRNTDQDGAERVAEALRASLADYDFAFEGKSVEIGCSLGVALYGSEIASAEDLLARADMAMRLAKQSGRNRVHLFREADKGERNKAMAEAGYANLIDGALRRGGLRAVFQPIVAMMPGESVARVVGHEALARLTDPDGAKVSMDLLMPSAERFGLAASFDRHMITLLCGQLNGNPEWLAGGFVSINLSAQSVGDQGVMQAIERLVDEAGLKPRQFLFEITETAALASLSAARSFIQALRAMGCRVALDDFGAGYSSFGYLRELPVDLIKLDGRLVRDIDSDPVKAAIVTAAITVAHAMGMQTIGEYVENQAVADCLAACGSDFAQGYLYGHPVTQAWPPAQAVALVEERERETVGLPTVPFLGDALPDAI